MGEGEIITEQSHLKDQFGQLEALANLIQIKSGVRSDVEEVDVSIAKSGASGASTLETKEEGRKVGFLLLGRGLKRWEVDRFENPAHELTHIILESTLERISSEVIRHPVSEGICDLVALEAVSEMFPYLNPREVIHRRYSLYRYFKRRKDETFEYFHHPDKVGRARQEEIGHVIGRRFVYTLKENFFEVPLAALIDCLVTHPPSREELLDPFKYFSILNSHEHLGKDIKPVAVRFSTERRRLI